MVSNVLNRVVPRHAERAVTEALATIASSSSTGARQSGKSTFVRVVAKDRTAEWRDLDTVINRQAATTDPEGFVAFPDLMVIDEIQRVPDLLLAIKSQVDRDPRPGRYLLTGSSRVLGLRGLPDTLPGRMETIELWPFSQGEIDGTPDGFVDAIFAEGAGLHHTSKVSRGDYAERLVRGGFPEVVARPTAKRRQHFFDSYVGDLIARDVSQLAEIERTDEMRALIRLVAARSGQLLVGTGLSNELGISANTVRRHLALLEEVFLIKRIPAWSRNISNRAVGTPKVGCVDSGIAANLVGADARSLVHRGACSAPCWRRSS